MADTTCDTILLVDDDSTGRSVRKMVLESHGHKVLAVGDAEVALRSLQEEAIGLVIVDYFLEDITGTELAYKMRQVRPDVPILLLSGSADMPPGIEYVDDYLSKLEPVSVIEHKIAELRRRHELGRIGPKPTAAVSDELPKSWQCGNIRKSSIT